jgi:crotonobetainyl-CoA:carnitine CoA-transferase CaiB-like acyl-CoA transferase
MGILAAYSHRLKTGYGQMVDTSLFEAALIQTYWQSAIALATGAAPRAMGSAHPLNAPYQAFEAKDGWFVVAGANPRNWLRLVEAIEAPELAQDPRFRENSDRMANLVALQEELGSRFKQHAVSHWLELFEAGGLPCGPVNDSMQALSDPQTKARQMVVELEHATAGRVPALGLPIKFSHTPGAVRRPAPLLGEHSREILGDIGFTDAQIDELERIGTIVTPSARATTDGLSD